MSETSNTQPELGQGVMPPSTEQKKSFGDALSASLSNFNGSKNSPYKRFQIAAKAMQFLTAHLKLDASKHISIICSPDGLSAHPKTEFGRALMEGR
jgi:hypothetical protein